MKTCTFFGHRDCPESVLVDLRQALRELIERQDVGVFLVGEQGMFDRLACRALEEMKGEFPHIRVEIVAAYFPRRKEEGERVLPEGMESVPARYAIDRRNRWMVLCKASHKTIYEKQIVM